MKTDEDLRIYVDDDGRTQATLAKSEKPEDELCDFCSQQERPFTVYKCKDFEAMSGLISRAEWNACPKCASYIDDNDQEGLTNRSVIMFAGGSDAPTELVREVLANIHKKFFQNRIK